MQCWQRVEEICSGHSCAGTSEFYHLLSAGRHCGLMKRMRRAGTHHSVLPDSVRDVWPSGSESVCLAQVQNLRWIAVFSRDLRSKNVHGAFFHETATQFGTFVPSEKGYHCTALRNQSWTVDWAGEIAKRSDVFRADSLSRAAGFTFQSDQMGCFVQGMRQLTCIERGVLSSLCSPWITTSTPKTKTNSGSPFCRLAWP